MNYQELANKINKELDLNLKILDDDKKLILADEENHIYCEALKDEDFETIYRRILAALKFKLKTEKESHD